MEQMRKRSPAAYTRLVSELKANGVKVPQLLLPEGREGAPKSQNFVPIHAGQGTTFEPRAQKINTEKARILQLLGLPAPKEGTVSGPTIQLPSDSRDLSMMERQAQKVNRSSSPIKTIHALHKTAVKKDQAKKRRDAFMNEPYADESKLPVIQMGKKPKSKTSGLPIIRI